MFSLIGMTIIFKFYYVNLGGLSFNLKLFLLFLGAFDRNDSIQNIPFFTTIFNHKNIFYVI